MGALVSHKKNSPFLFTQCRRLFNRHFHSCKITITLGAQQWLPFYFHDQTTVPNPRSFTCAHSPVYLQQFKEEIPRPPGLLNVFSTTTCVSCVLINMHGTHWHVATRHKEAKLVLDQHLASPTGLVLGMRQEHNAVYVYARHLVEECGTAGHLRSPTLFWEPFSKAWELVKHSFKRGGHLCI